MAENSTGPKVVIQESPFVVRTNAGSSPGTVSIERSFVLPAPPRVQIQIGSSAR